MTEHPSDSGGTEQEDDLVVAYVTGELTGRARMEFELRLASDPALAEQLQQFDEMDLVGSMLTTSTSSSASASASNAPSGQRSRRLLPWALALAAAASVAILIFVSGQDSIHCEVRAVASLTLDSPGDYAVALGMPAGTRIEGDGTRGSSSSTAAIPVDEFLASAAQFEAKRSESALAGALQPTATASSHVTLRFQSDRECSVVVLAQDSAGKLQRIYPSPVGRFVFAESLNRFAADTVHTLPRPNATRNQLGLVNLHRGFSADVIALHLAIRELPIPAALLEELDRVVGQQTPEQDLEAVVAWLAERGFSMHRVASGG